MKKINILADTRSLPPLYEMDDYLNCIQDETNQYCSVQAILETTSSNTYAKEIIQKLNQNIWTFDRSIIHRTLCLPQEKTQEISNLYTHSTKLINQNIQKFNLTAHVDEATCAGVKQEMSLYDYICLASLFFYVLLVIFATHNGKSFRNEKGLKGILSKLSIIYTWKQRTKVPDNVDYHNLLTMQGIRIITITAIIVGHVMLGYNFSFVLNSSEYEKIFSHALIKGVALLFIFIVLNFFLLSSWLLTLQVGNIVEKYGSLSLKHVGILIINRYFRLIITVVVIMAIVPTSWLFQLSGPTNFSSVIVNQQACKRNWFYSLTFTSNFLYILDICNPVTWYISADFQLFIINIAILYTKLKLKLEWKKLFGAILVFSCCVHCIFLYSFDAGVIFKPTLRNLEIRHFKRSVLLLVSYMSTISIWSSSIIGIIMAKLYSRTKDTIVKRTKFISILWLIAFFGLPVLALILSNIELSGFTAAFVGSIVRPLYTLGVGLGILGMSHKLGGPIRKFLKLKHMVLLGNFVYCVYLIHFGVIILFNRYMVSPLYINFWRVVQDSFIIIILSFIGGIFVTLGVEEIGIILQRYYLPQVSKWIPKSKASIHVS